MVIGHSAVVTALSTQLPPVTLLLGPSSVGKWTLVEHLVAHHRVAAADLMLCPDPLRIDTVRTIVRFVGSAPFGTFKLVAIALDGANEPAQNAMLNVLEEPPINTRFLLTASTPPLPTVLSRCAVFHLGLLSTSELSQVLVRTGMGAAVAARAAALGRGQVKAALKARTSDAARSTLLSVMRAVCTGDRVLFDRAFAGWDDNAHDLLVTWLREAITGQRFVFADADFFGMDRDQSNARRLVFALSRHPQARSRIGVRAALEPLLLRT